MVGKRAAAIALALAAAGGWTAAGTAQEAQAEKEKPPHWSDPLKDIPLGPFRLDIGGSVRFRYEYQSDFNQQRYADQRAGMDNQDHFLLQRTRLDFNLRFGEEARFHLQLQDARAYGSQFDEDDFPVVIHSCPYWNPLDLRQAYLEWLHIGGTPLGIKVGRHAIFYGDNRIWGPGEWGNVGRYTWDAIKVIADTELAEIHGILANRVRYDPHSFDEHNRRLDAFGAYAMAKGLPFQLDLFWVGKRSRPTMVVSAQGQRADLDTHTCGFRIDGTAGRWDYGGTLAHTRGERDNLDVDAWGAHAHLGHTFAHPWQPRLGVEFSYASGDSDPTDSQFETFDGLFGAIDAYYGRMNLFSWMNLEDYQLSFSCKPVKKVKLAIDYHFFRLDEARDAWYWCNGRPAQPNRQDRTGRSSQSVGHEIDLIASYKHSDHLQFMAGYAHFFPGPFVEDTGPSPGANWLFLQTMYSF